MNYNEHLNIREMAAGSSRNHRQQNGGKFNAEETISSDNDDIEMLE